MMSDKDKRLEKLKKTFNDDIEEITKLAESNTKTNENGEVVYTKEEQKEDGKLTVFGREIVLDKDAMKKVIYEMNRTDKDVKFKRVDMRKRLKEGKKKVEEIFKKEDD